MRFVLLSIISLFVITVLNAQEGTPCYFEFTADRYSSNQNLMQSSLSNLRKDVLINREQVILPVVVHVLYREESNNISEARIKEQLDVLNQGFNGRELTTSNIPASFLTSISTVNFRFCLASVDPNGEETTGITRKEVEQINIGSSSNLYYEDLGGVDAWDPDKYINIWVVETDGSFIGKASFPEVDEPEEQGIVMDVDFFGGPQSLNLDSNFDLGKTLIHEMGHYFGLEHLWGSDLLDCAVDDGIEDTPFTGMTYINTCLSHAYSCGSEDMTGNYMTYTSDACLYYFTEGQKYRMQQVLAQYRSDLLETPVDCSDLLGEVEQVKVSVIQKGSGGILFSLEIDDKTQEPCEAILYNLGGQVVWSKIIPDQEFFFLPMNNRPSGIYFFRLVKGEIASTVKVFWY
jgi:hypothetical protein